MPLTTVPRLQQTEILSNCLPVPSTLADVDRPFLNKHRAQFCSHHFCQTCRQTDTLQVLAKQLKSLCVNAPVCVTFLCVHFAHIIFARLAAIQIHYKC